MSPLELHILLWIYARPDKWPLAFCSIDVGNKTVVKLQVAGLVSPSTDGDFPETYSGWQTTPMANAYIEHIMQLPLPEQKWVMPE